MSWTFSPYVLPSLFAGVLAAAVAAFAWRHRTERTARPFIVLLAASAWWAVAYGIELGYTDLASIVLWDKIAFVGSVAAPAAFFWLAVEYAGYDDDLPAWTPAVLVIEPVVTLALVWAYPGSRWVWSSISVTDAGPLVLPVIEFGPWYWVNYGYSFVLVGSALVLIGVVLVRGSGIYRRQAALLIIGAIVPLGANLVYNLFPELSPFPAIDMTTFAMAFMGAVYGLGLFRFNMLDLAPVARGMLLSEVGDGYVVVNANGAVVEGSEVGRRVVETDEATFGGGSLSAGRLATLSGQIVSVTVDGTERSYEIRTRPVTDFRDERVGTLLVFRDITELEVIRQQEQRVAVMNRILRHNLRNTMNVVEGYSELLLESLSGEDRVYAERIAERAARMTSISEKARHFSADLDATGRREAVDVVPVVESVVERVGSAHPAATVSCAGNGPARALVTGTGDLAIAVEYVIENAIEHHDREEPTVEVRVETDDVAVVITVADDGPGIPAIELEALEAGSETSLTHGSGLGLWIVYWVVSQSDGELTFEDNEPRGTVVTMRLPRAG
ncbi:MAG: histidine kinase N-terminal 7TM domain-containing protein [Halobacteriales archaeon]